MRYNDPDDRLNVRWNHILRCPLHRELVCVSCKVSRFSRRDETRPQYHETIRTLVHRSLPNVHSTSLHLGKFLQFERWIVLNSFSSSYPHLSEVRSTWVQRLQLEKQKLGYDVIFSSLIRVRECGRNSVNIETKILQHLTLSTSLLLELEFPVEHGGRTT